MKRTATLVAFVMATPALAHHETHVTAFSPAAAAVAVGLIAVAVLAAPHVRAVFTRVTAR
ncbi:MAG: hypothetical protein AAF252_09065 [Pseudomonadota bacterium]